MGLETATYISDLIATNPTTADKRRQGDDHLRLIKAALLATFPNITGALSATHTELNFVDGVTSALQDQLDAKLAIATAPGAGLVEAGGVLAVGEGLGIVVNADDAQVEISGLAAIEGNALDPTNDGSLIDDNGVPKRMSFTDDGLVIVTEATDGPGTLRTLATADINTLIEFTASTGGDVVLNTGFGKKGNLIILEQNGTGQLTITGTATVNSPRALTTRARYSSIVLTCKGSDVWTLAGDIGS